MTGERSAMNVIVLDDARDEREYTGDRQEQPITADAHPLLKKENA
jgi:hypothetical protein